MYSKIGHEFLVCTPRVLDAILFMRGGLSFDAGYILGRSCPFPLFCLFPRNSHDRCWTYVSELVVVVVVVLGLIRLVL